MKRERVDSSVRRAPNRGLAEGSSDPAAAPAQDLRMDPGPVTTRFLNHTLKLQQLRIIATLANVGSVSKVASLLNVTQPAVSKQLAEMERALDAPLVTRERNRVFLTAIGHRLAFHATAVLEQLQRAAFDIESIRKGLTGHLRIGAVTSLAPTVLPEALQVFKQTAPLATVSITEGHFVNLLPMVENGGLDLAIARIWHPRALDGIEQMPLATEPVVVVAGREHPINQMRRATWSDAMAWPWIFPESSSVARQAIDNFFLESGLTAPRDVIESQTLLLNLELMRRMPYLGFFPETLALAHAARGELIVLPLHVGGVLSESRCFWRTGQADTDPVLSRFLECLRLTQTTNPGNT